VDARLADPLVGEPEFDFEDGSNLWIRMVNPGPDPVRFFRNPPSSTLPPTTTNLEVYPDLADYSFYAHNDLDLQIEGTVVWVVPQGASFRERVTIRALSGVPSTLVIVAKRNGRDGNGLEDRGLTFRGGLHMPDDLTRVYLVSEGDIGITHRYEPDRSYDARRLSVVAGGRVDLGGPEPGDRFRATYDPVAMDPLAERLFADGALPPLTASTFVAFQQLRPSWTELTPR
jgi:hypothetical protein